MSQPRLYSAARPESSTEVADLARCREFAAADDGEWLIVTHSDAAPTNPGKTAEFCRIATATEADAVSLPGDCADERSRLWRRGWERPAALLGLPGGVTLLRCAVVADLSDADAGFGAESDLLWGLAQAGARFAAIHEGTLETYGWTGRSPIPASGHRPPRAVRQALESLSAHKLVPSPASACDADAVLAGVLLMHDLLEESHQVSQSIEGEGTHVNGDYWHGIMHRREPDFGNSKYWFRRVGTHPVFAVLPAVAQQIADSLADDGVADWCARLTDGGWDAYAAVDLSSAAHARGCDPAMHVFAERLQWAEMVLLLEHSLRDATSDPSETSA